MKRLIKFGLIATLLIVLSACNSGGKDNDKTSDKLQVVTTFSILKDIVENVGGDAIEVHSMVPVGTDPHEYSPLPLDVQKATDADLIFYNGLNLEEGDGWFPRLIENVNKSSEQVIVATKDVEPMYLSSDDGTDDEINPHAFLDVNIGMVMVENIRDGLIKVDQDNSQLYEENAAKYLEQLQEIDLEYKEKIAAIKPERRILVTSEHAYQYMAKRYGLTPGYLWAIDTDEQGTPSQITSLVNFVKENEVPALFVESNVDPRPMETVSNETGVPIAAKLFSDELGKPGENGDTYVDFLRYNIRMIYENLK